MPPEIPELLKLQRKMGKTGVSLKQWVVSWSYGWEACEYWLLVESFFRASWNASEFLSHDFLVGRDSSYLRSGTRTVLCVSSTCRRNQSLRSLILASSRPWTLSPKRRKAKAVGEPFRCPRLRCLLASLLCLCPSSVPRWVWFCMVRRALNWEVLLWKDPPATSDASQAYANAWCSLKRVPQDWRMWRMWWMPKCDQMKRYKERIQNVIPLAVTREQLVAAQEIPQLVATIQVVNHLGDPKRCRIENDSFLSLYMPWGLDSRTPAMISQPSKKIRSDGSPGGWKQWRNETTESTALIDAWKAEVSKWLDDELATGLVEHGNLDFMFFAGNPQRGAFKEEVDKLLSPGIFTDECLGHTRFSDSRSGVFSKIIDIIQNPKIDSKMDLEHLKSWQFVSLICWFAKHSIHWRRLTHEVPKLNPIDP